MTAAEAIAAARDLAAAGMVRMLYKDEALAVLLSASEAHAEGSCWFISGTDGFGESITLQVEFSARQLTVIAADL